MAVAGIVSARLLKRQVCTGGRKKVSGTLRLVFSPGWVSVQLHSRQKQPMCDLVHRTQRSLCAKVQVFSEDASFTASSVLKFYRSSTFCPKKECCSHKHPRALCQPATAL